LVGYSAQHWPPGRSSRTAPPFLAQPATARYGRDAHRGTTTTPQLFAKLTIHEADSPATAIAGSLTAFPPRRFPARWLRSADGEQRRRRSLLWREALQRRLLAVADVIGAGLALTLVVTVPGGYPALLVAAGMPLLVVLFKVAGLYDRDQLRIVHSTLDDAPALAQLTGLYALIATILQPVLIEGDLRRAQIAGLWLGTLASVMGGRMLARWLAAHVSPPERCLVIGERDQAARIREKFVSSRARATVVATLPLDGDDLSSGLTSHSVREMVAELRVHRIVIAPITADAGGVVDLIRVAKAAGVRVSILPRILEVVGSAVEFEDVDGMTMLGVRPFGMSRSSRALKRAFDIAAASVGLVVIAPLMATLAVAIRLDTRGPVLFSQVRVGRGGRHFRIFKFRTMVVGADEQKDRLRELNEVGAGMFKISADPRVTRVGGFLRRTSFDELPQLFNVLRSDMSLVGPRPLVVDEDAQVLGLDRSRLHLTPGITGPWQVLGNRAPMREMLGIDYLYVANWSLWLDVKLLLRTVRHVLCRGNV
jgi:exopolysaccharide biosynthesis polyprenyl glycosylphosphotransferase